jgi:hypothetical protein
MLSDDAFVFPWILNHDIDPACCLHFDGHLTLLLAKIR